MSDKEIIKENLKQGIFLLTCYYCKRLTQIEKPRCQSCNKKHFYYEGTEDAGPDPEEEKSKQDLNTS